MEYEEFESKVRDMNSVDIDEVKYLEKEDSVVFKIELTDPDLKSKITNLGGKILEEGNTYILMKI